MQTHTPARRPIPAALILFLAAFAAAVPAQAQAVDPPPDVTVTVPVDTPTDTPEETPSPEEPEQKRPRQKLRIGPEVSVFVPASGKTRDYYGDAWWGIGLGFGSVKQVGLLGTLSGEIFLIHNDGDAEAYIVPVGIAYRRALAGSSPNARPYFGGSLNIIAADFNAPQENVGWGLRFGAGASAIAGTTFGNRGYFEARYLLTTSMKGLSFSGLHAHLGVRF